MKLSSKTIYAVKIPLLFFSSPSERPWLISDEIHVVASHVGHAEWFKLKGK